MHCPKCGDVLEDGAGTFRCRRGQMQLSRQTAEALHAHFISESEIAKNVRPDTKHEGRWGGRWFCPKCGVSMLEDTAGEVRCPKCKRDIAPFVYHLIELHPHAKQS